MTLEAHKESDQKVLDEASLHNYNNSSRRFSDQPDFVLGQPLKVSWETVVEMTFGFRTRILADEKSDYSVYEGFWEPVYGSQVMVMRYNTTACTSTSPGNSRGVLEAEKKAALSMHHKNILSLAGYCNCDNTMILIFPSAKRGSLETNLYGKLARPLLMKGAFHELLDEKWDADIHEMFRVMYTASQCIETSPDSRPCMSEGQIRNTIF
ncbi:unnamed protein product [Malus baccata var. baccata]